jgi:predicted amidohydrolase YtcJ
MILRLLIRLSLLALTCTAREDENHVSDSYCYETLTTLDATIDPKPNCFRVSHDGLIADVYHGKPTLKGHVYPGLWDGHGHLLQYGELLKSVDLFGSHSLEDALSRVAVYAAAHPEAGTSTQWLRGVGWDQAAFGRMPTASDLDHDPQLKDKYIMLDRIDVHCIWVSPTVLKLLPDPIPDIPGGEMPAEGVFCDNAMDLVMQSWPKPTKEQKIGFAKAAMQELNAVGLVGMHDAGVTPENLKLYRELALHEDWSVRVYAMLECEKRNTFCGDANPMIESSNGMLSMKSVKLFAGEPHNTSDAHVS